MSDTTDYKTDEKKNAAPIPRPGVGKAASALGESTKSAGDRNKADNESAQTETEMGKNTQKDELEMKDRQAEQELDQGQIKVNKVSKKHLEAIEERYRVRDIETDHANDHAKDTDGLVDHGIPSLLRQSEENLSKARVRTLLFVTDRDEQKKALHRWKECFTLTNPRYHIPAKFTFEDLGSALRHLIVAWVNPDHNRNPPVNSRGDRVIYPKDLLYPLNDDDERHFRGNPPCFAIHLCDNEDSDENRPLEHLLLEPGASMVTRFGPGNLLIHAWKPKANPRHYIRYSGSLTLHPGTVEQFVTLSHCFAGLAGETMPRRGRFVKLPLSVDPFDKENHRFIKYAPPQSQTAVLNEAVEVLTEQAAVNDNEAGGRRAAGGTLRTEFVQRSQNAKDGKDPVCVIL